VIGNEIKRLHDEATARCALGIGTIEKARRSIGALFSFGLFGRSCRLDQRPKELKIEMKKLQMPAAMSPKNGIAARPVHTESRRLLIMGTPFE